MKNRGGSKAAATTTDLPLQQQQHQQQMTGSRQPRIFKNQHYYRHHGFSRYRKMVSSKNVFFMVVMLIFGWVFHTIIKFIGNTFDVSGSTSYGQNNNYGHQHHHEIVEWHPPPSAFPLLNKAIKIRTTQRPEIAQGNPLILDDGVYKTWDEYGTTPILGSYQYNANSTIHFPHTDLQTYYHEHKPDFHNLKGGYPQSVVMTHVKSPDSNFALLTRKGNKFAASGVRANQDRVVIMSPFNSLVHDNQNNANNVNWWMGLFDGHGELGHVMAHDAALLFPEKLMEKLHGINNDNPLFVEESQKQLVMMKDQLKETFLDTHHSLPNLSGSGCTGISILKYGHELYISNVGDSLAFIASYDHAGNNIEILYETKPHKPDIPQEQQRIESMGGQVIPKPVGVSGGTARVIIPSSDPNQPPGMDLALAMSRSLGDFDGDPIGVIAEPTTDIIDLNTISERHQVHHTHQHHDPTLKRYYMVIVASDGLMDKISPYEVAQHVAKSLLPIHPVSPLPALEQLILKSSNMWLHDVYGGEYRDDISIGVHKLII